MSADNSTSYVSRLYHVFVSFFLLGWTSFGGPAAHLGYFNQEFIKAKKWATESQYAQWVALSQVVPGPGSSQVGFALGYHRAGFFGGVAAFVGFTLPSFIIMVALAMFGAAWQGHTLFDGVLYGLKLLAVVVVADACVSMWRSFCQTKVMAAVAIIGAASIVFLPFPFISLIILVLAALFGLTQGSSEPSEHELLPSVPFTKIIFAIALMLFVASFFFDNGLAGMFADFYKAGALVFGGGHVVLPMLSAFVSDTASSSDLLLGYAAAQAVPGPMFTMASFLGAAATPEGSSIWLWALVGTLAVFLPGLMLMLCAQSAWQKLANYPRFRSAINSLNAAVVGILIAALYSPIATSSLFSVFDVLIVLAGFAWLKYKRPSIFLLILAYIVIGVVFGLLA
ncbi:chromate efflux transporter [Marinomonas sp. C2222]|uniref:Chromate efflux transporter n=1 Tax=Marinomonas sargassi TaxID=2984494 RepID=A0ABT2YPA6_9GAMM|nr:chromate efflux transporter [Marinomonas sargassi]MCV2401671.1 chromate efflux transporter [Marinomonas sargassi]